MVLAELLELKPAEIIRGLVFNHWKPTYKDDEFFDILHPHVLVDSVFRPKKITVKPNPEEKKQD